MIELCNVSVKYGDREALKSVSLSIRDKQFTSIIGTNGSGKSTMLLSIANLLPYTGEIIIDNKNAKSYDRSVMAKTVSLLKQENSTNICITVRDLIGFGRYPYSKGHLNKRDQKIIDRYIEYMDLKDIQDYYITDISGGERQRSYIAMMLAQDTKYLLLDEPLNNLDMKSANNIMKILKSLVIDLDKTVVVILHDINFASIYSDMIIALSSGYIVDKGTPEVIITPSMLDKIYDLDIKVINHDGKKFCDYYT